MTAFERGDFPQMVIESTIGGAATVRKGLAQPGSREAEELRRGIAHASAHSPLRGEAIIGAARERLLADLRKAVAP
ncbi:MAG: hypothetical protein KGL39_41875 [Patescibacteria group bacterium]|nr:hypothetical protein [Patescibacteria group bacterium]